MKDEGEGYRFYFNKCNCKGREGFRAIHKKGFLEVLGKKMKDEGVGYRVYFNNCNCKGREGFSFIQVKGFLEVLGKKMSLKV